MLACLPMAAAVWPFSPSPAQPPPPSRRAAPLLRAVGSGSSPRAAPLRRPSPARHGWRGGPSSSGPPPLRRLPPGPPPPLHLWVSSTRNARRTSSPPAQRPAPVSSSPCRCALPLHWCPQPRRTPLPRPTHLYARCVSFSSVQAAGVSRLSRPCNASLSFNLLPLPVSFPLPGWNCPAALPLLRRDDSYLRLLLQFHRLQYSRCDCGGC